MWLNRINGLKKLSVCADAFEKKSDGDSEHSETCKVLCKASYFQEKKKKQKLYEWYIRHDLIITPKMSRMDTNCKSTAVTMQLWISGLIDLEEQ